MSHSYKKIQYQTEAEWGTTETHTLYAHSNDTCDIVSIYDDEGGLLLCYSENIGAGINMGQALIKLLTKWDSQESMTKEEILEKIYKDK